MYSNPLIISLITFLNDNFKSKITIDEIALKFNYNKYYLIRLFKKELGLTIFEYLNKKKIYYALALLKEDKSFLEIALESGFYSEEYFSEVFKNILGISARDYKSFLNHKKVFPKKKKEFIIKKRLELEGLIAKVNYYLVNKKPILLVKVKKII